MVLSESLFSVINLLPFAVFGVFTATIWLVLEWLSAQKPRVDKRLDDLCDFQRYPEVSDGLKTATSDKMAKVLEKATPVLAKALQPKSAEEEHKLQRRLVHAGFRSETAPTIFLGLKILGLILGVFCGGGLLIAMGNYETMTLLKTSGGAFVMFFVPDLILILLASCRKQAIFLGLPDALDLMVVCVEAGLGLDAAMRKVSEETKKSTPQISQEFAICNMQLQMGKTRSDVLKDLGARNGVDDLKTLASILIQADKFGSSIAQALRVQSDAMRTRRRQLAEEKAAKTAVKLIFPLVIFIFPGIFVVLVGPAAITMVRQMFPAMQGG